MLATNRLTITTSTGRQATCEATPKMAVYSNGKTQAKNHLLFLEASGLNTRAGTYCIYNKAGQIVYVGMTEPSTPNEVTRAAFRHFYKYNDEGKGNGKQHRVSFSPKGGYEVQYIFPVSGSVSISELEKILIIDIAPKNNERDYKEFQKNLGTKLQRISQQEITGELEDFTKDEVFSDSEVKALQLFASKGVKENDSIKIKGKTYKGEEIQNFVDMALDLELIAPF